MTCGRVRNSYGRGHRRGANVSRRASALFFAGLLTITASCHRSFNEPVSVLNMADKSATDQLITGFYPVENDSFRWVSRQFSVAVRPPAGADQRGATLQVTLYLPEKHIQELGPITLNADAGGYVLEPETFSAAGTFTYSRDIPASELDTNIFPIHFCLNKWKSGSRSDPRELGVVVTGIALRAR
jgi:hypothetical protein